MKFTFAVQKLKRADVSRAKGHNLRLHPTSSQLRPEAWWWAGPRTKPNTTAAGYAWRDDRIDHAVSLAKRKDAVVAIEIVLQIGNQVDWREPPTEDFPEGRPKPLEPHYVRDYFRSAIDWAEAEFGPENVCSVQLHTDESSPHMHIVVTPVKDGKLQAKHWLDGGSKLAVLRKRCHAAISARIPCEYTPGGAGGKPHDPSRRAGAEPVPSVADKLTGHSKARKAEATAAALRERVAELEQQLRVQDKARYYALRARESAAKAEMALAMAEAAERSQRAAEEALKVSTVRLSELERQTAKQAQEIGRLEQMRAVLSDECNELEARLKELEPSGYKPSA